MRVLRVDMQMFTDTPAPTRNRISSVNLRRTFAGEDWCWYNRRSLWIRPEVSVAHAAAADRGAQRWRGEGTHAYYREGIHYVTLANNGWQQVVWEIEPLARDRVTTLEIGYWVNQMLAAPGDRVGCCACGFRAGATWALPARHNPTFKVPTSTRDCTGMRSCTFARSWLGSALDRAMMFQSTTAPMIRRLRYARTEMCLAR